MLAAAGFALLLPLSGPGPAQGPGRAEASEDGVPPSRLVVIIMRALAYDGNLKVRAGDTINIGVLHKRGHSGSEKMARTMLKAFGALAATPVAGLPIAVSRLSYAGSDSLGKAVAASGIDILFICEGLVAEVAPIAEVTRRMKVLTVASQQEQVHKGLSLGVFQIDGRTTILLNLPSSRREGVAFAADLLRLAVVIR
jgi:hypothetical protein